ncbi:MAG: hypothetical protein H8E60_04765 [Candidatus Marinimicrobia bacterium]|nr:hypothetical protein [Candidatus Neomarinimicrobiota bacterium]
MKNTILISLIGLSFGVNPKFIEVLNNLKLTEFQSSLLHPQLISPPQILNETELID